MTEKNDFTETAYRNLIQLVLQSGYDFIPFTNAWKYDGPHVLWRHDIDMSPHRAAKISQIEAEENVTSTYFLHLHSCFYNLFEESAASKIFDIIDNGHEIGLHYDLEFYKKHFPLFDPIKMVDTEATFIRDIFSIRPTAISFHNPRLSSVEIASYHSIHGLINAHSSFIRKNYTYCSDSNNKWNYSNLEDAIYERKPRLHVLTHPEWWTTTQMTQMEKVERCIVGRCDHQRRIYNVIMENVYANKN